MPNDRLRTAMLGRGVTPADLAAALDVDTKSVERWISPGRTPYRRHRYAVAAHLGVDEAYLWPDALNRDQVANASESEIVNIYPHRWAVPSDLWRNFFDNAEQDIGVLVYSGLFLAEDAGIQRVFRNKADAGKIRNAIVLYKPLRNIDGIEFRLHDTVLYNSIYRADDQVLVNTHIYNFPAAQAPVLHLRRVAGGDMVTTYLESFDHVWNGASPLE